MKFFLKTAFYFSVIYFSVIILTTGSGHSKTVMQLMPTLTISEEYSDNYFQRETDEKEEFITSFRLGFSLGFIERKSKIYLSYEPEYKKYKNLDDRDGFAHNLGLDGEFNPTKFTTINANLAFTSDDDEDPGSSWENSASISGITQLTRHTKINYSQYFSRSFDQQQSTGDYEKYDVSRTAFKLTNQFGEKSSRGLNVSYRVNSYDESDADEYTKFNPSGFITWWFNPLNAFELRAEYEKTDYDNSYNDLDTYVGSIRYIKQISRHFDGYVKYRQSWSERDSGDHHIYHPSIGFDWDVTEDSGITLGIGVLISEWDGSDNEDTTDPFIDLDAYKIFNFSRRGSLAITASSGYEESNDDAASLGYYIYYKAGAKLDYQLQKRLSSFLSCSYQLEDYQEDSVDENDTEIKLSGGLSWQALKWLRFNLNYDFIRFETDRTARGDYDENKIYFSVSFIPKTPIRFDTSPSRQALDSELFE